MDPQLIVPGQVNHTRFHRLMIKSGDNRKELQDDPKAAGTTVTQRTIRNDLIVLSHRLEIAHMISRTLHAW